MGERPAEDVAAVATEPAVQERGIYLAEVAVVW
jgi:hypothetical protein